MVPPMTCEGRCCSSCSEELASIAPVRPGIAHCSARELLLRLGDLGRGGGQRVGAAGDRDVAGVLHLLAEHARVGGGAERAGRQGQLDVGVGEHALLRGDAALVRLEQLRAADEVRADGDGVERRPAGPAGVRDAGALARVVDVGGRAVDADGAHERAAEPGGEPGSCREWAKVLRSDMVFLRGVRTGTCVCLIAYPCPAGTNPDRPPFPGVRPVCQSPGGSPARPGARGEDGAVPAPLDRRRRVRRRGLPRAGRSGRSALLPEALTDDLDGLVAAVRQQPGDGGALRAGRRGRRVLRRRPRAAWAGCACCCPTSPPRSTGTSPRRCVEHLDIDVPGDDDLEEVWPAGDLGVFDDLGLDEMELGAVLSDLDAYADEMLVGPRPSPRVRDAYERVVDALVRLTRRLSHRPEPAPCRTSPPRSPAPSEGWTGVELDLDEVEDLEALADLLRDLTGDGRGPGAAAARGGRRAPRRRPRRRRRGQPGRAAGLPVRPPGGARQRASPRCSGRTPTRRRPTEDDEDEGTRPIAEPVGDADAARRPRHLRPTTCSTCAPRRACCPPTCSPTLCERAGCDDVLERLREG